MNIDSKLPDAIANWHNDHAANGNSTVTTAQMGPIEIGVVTLPSGHQRVNLLRAHSVFVVPVIKFRNDTYTLLTCEARPGAGGKHTLQFPAETGETGEPIRCAAERALTEETDEQSSNTSAPRLIDYMSSIKLLPMGPENYVSLGSTNEQIWYAAANITLPDEVDVHTFDNRATGLVDHGENIKTQVHPLNLQLYNELSNASCKLALLLVTQQVPK